MLSKSLLIDSNWLLLAFVVRDLLDDFLHDGSVPARMDTGKRHIQVRVCLDRHSLLGVILRDVLENLRGHKGSSVLERVAK